MPRDVDLCALEHLEPRALLDSQFASVALAWEHDFLNATRAVVFATEGTLFTNGAVSGESFIAGGGGRDDHGPLPYDAYNFLTDGRFERIDPDSFLSGTLDETNGADFRADKNHSAGWWYADYRDPGQELEYLVERSTNATLADIQGSWRFSLVAVDYDSDDFFNVSGRLVISGDEIEWRPSLGSLDRQFSDIQSVSSSGVVETFDGEVLYLNADEDVLIFADMDESDGQVYVGVAVRTDQDFIFEQLIGNYYLTWAFTGSLAGSNDLAFAQRFLELESDGDYKLYDLDAYDDGNREPIDRGFWSVSGSVLTLDRSNSEVYIRFRAANNGTVLIPFEYDDSGFDRAIAGLASRAGSDEPPPPPPPPPAGLPVFTVDALNEFSRSVVYEWADDENWYASDLVRLAGGPNITGEVVTWVDSRDGRSYAAAVTDSGLILYRHAGNGQWTFRNLNTELETPDLITDGLSVMISPNDLVHLTGLTADNEIVRFYQTGNRLNPIDFEFAFQNIHDQELVPAGEQTPAFSGPLVSYSTAWGGLNVAGIDAQGNIWSVWWAPGAPRWTASNLTTALGATPVVGGLTVYLTDWNGINIAGIDADGHIQVTWWVPQFEGNWARNDLTLLTDGPRLRAPTVSSYVTTWSALNIAGVDDATGELVVYWWVPQHTEIGWVVSSLSDAVDGTAPTLVDTVVGTAADDNSLNVTGRSATGDLHRFYWEPGFEGQWRVQDITDIAINF